MRFHSSGFIHLEYIFTVILRIAGLLLKYSGVRPTHFSVACLPRFQPLPPEEGGEGQKMMTGSYPRIQNPPPLWHHRMLEIWPMSWGFHLLILDFQILVMLMLPVIRNQFRSSRHLFIWAVLWSAVKRLKRQCKIALSSFDCIQAPSRLTLKRNPVCTRRWHLSRRPWGRKDGSCGALGDTQISLHSGSGHLHGRSWRRLSEMKITRSIEPGTFPL